MEITTDEEDAKNSGDSESNASLSSRKKKRNRDNLAKFERKMTQRLLMHSARKEFSGKVEPMGSLRIQNVLKKQKLNHTANSASAFKAAGYSGMSTPAKTSG